jgi:hypothetical protein
VGVGLGVAGAALGGVVAGGAAAASGLAARVRGRAEGPVVDLPGVAEAGSTTLLVRTSPGFEADGDSGVATGVGSALVGATTGDIASGASGLGLGASWGAGL